MSMENILDAAQLTLSVCSLAQQKAYASKKKDYSTKRHEEMLRKHKELHEERVELGKSVYTAEAIYSFDEHILSLDSDLLNNSKESERDMFDQRIQLYETVIFAASVIFGSLSTLIIRGILPNSAANIILRPILNEDVLDLLAVRLHDEKSAKAVSETYKDHAKRVNEKLQDKRIKMFKVYQDFNESFSLRLKYSDFQTYWEDECEDWGKIGIFFLNIGTVFLLLAILVLMYAKWGNVYHSVAGAVAAISLILLGILVFCVLNWSHVVMKRLGQLLSETSSNDDVSSTEDELEAGVEARRYSNRSARSSAKGK